MWAWLLNLFTPIIEWISSILVTDLFSYLKNKYDTYQKEQAAKKQGETNVQKEKDAVAGGNLDDIAKTGQDVLNGGIPKP